MKKRIVFFISFLVMLMMACSLISNTGTGTATVTDAGTTPQNQPGNIIASPTPSPTANPNPVSINEGLGSLNSYIMTVQFITKGPDPSQSTTITVELQHSNDNDATLTHLNATTVPKGGGKPKVTDSYIYRIGNDECSGSSDSWTWTSFSPAQSDILGVVKSMLAVTPLIDNPVYVAQETVNDILSNHFTFTPTGLSDTSGAVVNINQGEYWLAVDGQYIVKGDMVVETSESDNSSVYHEEGTIDLTQINLPVDISFPQGCLDASKVTPSP